MQSAPLVLVDPRILFTGSLILTLGGCVSAGKYDAAVADAQQAQAALASSRSDSARLSADKQRIERELALKEDEHARALVDARSRVAACGQELDGATALNSELRTALERLGKDADELLSAKGELATALERTRVRLEDLRKAQAAAERRAALFRDLALKLKRQIDAGDLQIALRSGRMVLVLRNDVLFDSGKTDLKPRGKETLAEVANALAGFPGRRFQVAGHTDDEPIKFSGYRSNWELSSARAVEVVALLIGSGMPPAALSTAGYGEFDPVTANDSAENKAWNRRIEITLQPNIDELVAVPAAL